MLRRSQPVMASASAEAWPGGVSPSSGAPPGPVMAPLRQGLKRVRFPAPKSTAETLRNLASQYDAEIVPGALAAPDLMAQAQPEAACRRWLSEA